MSLIKHTGDLYRATEVVDAAGGVTETWAAVYTGLSATLNYPTPRAVDRLEAAGQGGPGVRTRSKIVLIFDPKPSGVTLIENDEWRPTTGDFSGLRFVLQGVRPYEVTLQADVERVA